MIDKYTALKNTTDWIANSSSEEFKSTFNELGDNYSGLTIGDFLSEDEEELEEIEELDESEEE